MTNLTDTDVTPVNSERALKLAQDLIKIPSFTFQETKLAGFIYDYFLKAGFEVKLETINLPGGKTSQQVIARWVGSQPGPKAILCGHMDILDIYRPDRWTFDPFCGDIVDGWLRGQGSLNMKAGLAAIIAAVEALRDGGFKPRGEIVIAAVMGEIVGGLGIRDLLSKEKDFDYGIVAEPTNLNISNISVGTAQGSIRLWGDTLYFNPHPNPIYGMVKIIEALGPAYSSQQPGNWMTFEPCPDLPGFPRFNVRNITSGQDYCEIFFDTRTVPGQSNATLAVDLQSVVDKVLARVPGLQAEIHTPPTPETSNFPAMTPTPVDHPLVQTMAAAHKKVIGQPPFIGSGDRIGLASDASHMKAAGIPAVDYGPGKHPRWPMWDECIRVDDVINSCKVLAETIRGMHS